MTLEGQIVHGDDRRRPPGAVVMQIGRRQRRLPVMGVHDIGRKARRRALADIRADPRQRRKTQRVVGPIETVRTQIRIARPREKMRRVEHEQLESARRGGQQRRRPAEQPIIAADGLAAVEFGEQRGVAGRQRDRRDIFARQRARQGAHDVGEAARLDQRKDFRGDGENLQLRHGASLSNIGWVIRQMPSSVRRNRLASSSGSSPTTRPSGMTTPRSTTTFESWTFRPIST